MGGKNTPDVPSANDYMRVAEKEASLAKDLINEQTVANRPNQYTPYGSTTWTEDDGRWEQTIALPETQQAALDSQQEVSLGRSQMAEGMLGRAETELGAPIQWQAMEANEVLPTGEYGTSAEDALYGRSTSRLDPMWEQREEATYNQLWNQGLRPGDEAWDTAMANMGRERTDAYQTAMTESQIYGGQEAERMFEMDTQRRQQAIAEELQRRGATLNEINAVLSGQQVSAPGMPSFQAAGSSRAPDLTGALNMGAQGQMDQYTADQMNQQGLYSGLGNIAMGAMMFSDRRLKTHVVHVGHTLGRQPFYRYTMFGRTMLGVMADESPPDAVSVHPSGYLMVDYSRIV